MTDAILRDLAIGVIAVSLVAGASVLIGASIYDIKQTRNRRQASKKVGRRARPLVSVVVYSHNQPEETLACLASLLKSSHRKLEVIVVNNGSNDHTKQALKEFKAKHSKRAIKIINKRHSGSLQPAVKSGLKAVRGGIVLILDGDYSVERGALSRAADGLSCNEKVALIPATAIDDYPSALNLWARFKSLLGLNWQKTASLLRPSGSGLHFGVFYSRQMIAKPKSDQDYHFASEIVLRRHLRPSVSNSEATLHELAVERKAGKKSALRPLLSSFKLLYKVLALPIFTWYALYLATNQGYSYLLFISWAIFSFIFIFVIWTTDYLNYSAKAKLTLLAPAVFSLAVVMVFVEAVAAVIRPLAAKLGGTASKVRLAV